MTESHADATLQAHGRFVQRAAFDAELRAELAQVVSDSDRRMRWTIRAHRMFSPSTLATMKKVAGWGAGSLPHRKLSLDGAQPAALASYAPAKGARG